MPRKGGIAAGLRSHCRSIRQVKQIAMPPVSVTVIDQNPQPCAATAPHSTLHCAVYRIHCTRSCLVGGTSTLFKSIMSCTTEELLARASLASVLCVELHALVPDLQLESLGVGLAGLAVHFDLHHGERDAGDGERRRRGGLAVAWSHHHRPAAIQLSLGIRGRECCTW